MNQIRNSWRFQKEDRRIAEGFFDGSIWEQSKRTSPESLKALIRRGIKNTSVTAVLVGRETWSRRWVRYKIARSIEKGNGLLAVKIHQLNDFSRQTSSEGPNPLDFMGVYRDRTDIRLAEWKDGNWVPYQDYTEAVSLPSTWAEPNNTSVIQPSYYAPLYCNATHSGYENFPVWVRNAATRVGR